MSMASWFTSVLTSDYLKYVLQGDDGELHFCFNLICAKNYFVIKPIIIIIEGHKVKKSTIRFLLCINPEIVLFFSAASLSFGLHKKSKENVI